MKLGFYYSQANDWFNPGGAAARGHWDPTQKGSMDEYIEKVAVPQVQRDTDAIWRCGGTLVGCAHRYEPGSVPINWRHCCPCNRGIITNDRLGGHYKGDITTPEQYIPATGIEGRDWGNLHDDE